MISRPSYNPGPYDDDLGDAPAGYGWQTWGLGLVLAAAIGGYEIAGLRTLDVTFAGSRMTEHLTGARATAVSVAYLGIATLLFCHYFIQNWRPMAWYAVLGKIAGL